MGDLEILAAEFVGEQERIRTLRSADPAFEEICADYVALYRKLAALERAVGPDLNHAVDLRESLGGLEREIRHALQSSRERTTRKRGPE